MRPYHPYGTAGCCCYFVSLFFKAIACRRAVELLIQLSIQFTEENNARNVLPIVEASVFCAQEVIYNEMCKKADCYSTVFYLNDSQWKYRRGDDDNLFGNSIIIKSSIVLVKPS